MKEKLIKQIIKIWFEVYGEEPRCEEQGSGISNRIPR